MRLRMSSGAAYQVKHGMLTMEELKGQYLRAAAMWLQYFTPVVNILSLSVFDLQQQLKADGLYRMGTKKAFKAMEKAVDDLERLVMKSEWLDFGGENMDAFLDFQDNFNDALAPRVKSLYWAINLKVTKSERYQHVESVSQVALVTLLAMVLESVDKVLHKNWEECWHHTIILPWEKNHGYAATQICRLANHLAGILAEGKLMNLQEDPHVNTAVSNLINWLASFRVVEESMSKAITRNPGFAEKIGAMRKGGKA